MSFETTTPASQGPDGVHPFAAWSLSDLRRGHRLPRPTLPPAPERPELQLEFKDLILRRADGVGFTVTSKGDVRTFLRQQSLGASDIFGHANTIVDLVRAEQWDDIAAMLNRLDVSNVVELKPDKKPSRFAGKNLDDLEALGDGEWLVDKVIPVGQFFMLYGPRKAGKTFLALDMGLCIATGRAWHGRPVRQGRVLHIIGEGGLAFFKNRIKAWIKYHAKRDDAEAAELRALVVKNYIVVGFPVHMDRIDIVREFMAANPGEWSMVIIDTLLRNMMGNPNDIHDAAKFVGGVDKVREQKKTAVLLLHHQGKDASKGAMGATTFEADVDGAGRVLKKGKLREFEITLMRDATEDQPKLTFALERVVMNDLADDFEGDEPKDELASAVLVLADNTESRIGTVDKVLLAVFNHQGPGKVGPTAIAASLKITKQTVSEHGAALISRGDLNADWTLTESGRKYANGLTDNEPNED
jgi:AAA domain